MKSSGPVERLLRALGRRDSSRATSRVGVPTSWAEEGQGWRCGQWGRGPGDQIPRPDPLPQPSPAALHLRFSLPLWLWPGLWPEQQKSGLEQNRYQLWLLYHLPTLVQANPGGPLHLPLGILHCRTSPVLPWSSRIRLIPS